MADGDQQTLLAHLQKTSFLSGVEQGKWTILRLEFPVLEVLVAGTCWSGLTTTMDFQLQCDGFPAVAPFVQHWDPETKSRPAPPDQTQAPASIVDALKTWSEKSGGYDGIYRPWQRHAANHNGWAGKRPDLAWNRQRDLTFIMEQLYALVSEQAFWLDSQEAA